MFSKQKKNRLNDWGGECSPPQSQGQYELPFFQAVSELMFAVGQHLKSPFGIRVFRHASIRSAMPFYALTKSRYSSAPIASAVGPGLQACKGGCQLLKDGFDSHAQQTHHGITFLVSYRDHLRLAYLRHQRNTGAAVAILSGLIRAHGERYRVGAHYAPYPTDLARLAVISDAYKRYFEHIRKAAHDLFQKTKHDFPPC